MTSPVANAEATVGADLPTMTEAPSVATLINAKIRSFTRKDVEGVIRALEGMQMKNSIGHPQGDKMLRKKDHVGIIDCYISRVENGRLEVKKKIPKEELVKHMPVRFNLSTMAA